MPDLYPDIEPYAQGMLEVTDGELVYSEACGNPRGKPAVVLHGGPGSRCTPWHRRLFDPAVYRVVPIRYGPFRGRVTCAPGADCAAR